MAEWIYRIQPARLEMLTKGPTTDEQQIVGEHFAYLEQLTRQGVLVLAGRTLNDDERTFGIAVFRAPDAASAQAIVDGDPAVRKGVMRAELFPFRVALLAGAR